MKKTLLLTAVLFAVAPWLRAAETAENWEKNCASCHGKDGKGATKAGRMAGTKDFTDAAYQKTFTDDVAFKNVKEGTKDAKGKDKMKPFADKLSDDEIKALAAFVRTLAK